MAELTAAERVLRTLRREEVDRIPHFEWIIDHRVREAILPGCTMEEFTVRMGLDAILTGPNFSKEKVGDKKYRNEWGVISEDSGEEHMVPIEGPIQTLEDFANYHVPDPHARGRYASLERVVAKYKGQLAIGVHLNDVFSIPRNLMGYEGILMALAADQDLVRKLVEMSVEVNIEMAREVARRGADFVFTGDDFSSTHGPLMSPDTFAELFAGPLKRVITGFRDQGLYVIKHTDGNIMSLLPWILDSGIHCLDPIDPIAGMDIGQLKRDYGQRIALKGNVDCAQTLTFGSVADTVRETREVIRKAGVGGGLILSSSNSVHSAVKPGNYLAMWNAVRVYGKYPLKLDSWGEEDTGNTFA